MTASAAAPAASSSAMPADTPLDADASPLGRPLTWRDRLGFLAMVIGMFMAILDIQIVASSLSEIQAGISASRDEISWVQTSYLIAEVIMIPLAAWLARVLSTRILFAASALAFTAASVACAFAWSLESMIVFRAFQGFLGGAMIPTVFAAAYAVFPRSRQAGVTVVVGLVATVAPTLGPTLGGWLTESFSWHWLFLVNTIPGALVGVAVLLWVDFDRPDYRLLRGFDLPGVLLVALFLGCLQFVLEEGPGEDWFQSSEIVLFSAVTLLAGLLFFARELTALHPVVDLRAFANPNFALGCAYSFLIGVGLYGSVYVMPLFLSGVRGYNALQIGTVIMVTGAFQFLSAPLAGALSRHLDPRAMLGLGLLLFGVGLALNHPLTADWGWDQFFLPQAVRGVSLMFLFIPVNALALGTLSQAQIKGGSGLYNLMRNLGGAIGLAVIATTLETRTDLHAAHLAEGLNPARPGVLPGLDTLTQALAPALGAQAPQAALAQLQGLVLREASVMAFADLFLLMAVPFAVGLAFLPLMRRAAPGAAAAAGH